MIESFLIFIGTIIMEIIDSGLGMMYGTLLTPILLLIGYPVSSVIPAILISQAVGGITGTIFHHKYKNADFNGLTNHMKIVIAFVSIGIIAVILGVSLASKIPDTILKIYIGIMVIIMGLLCLITFRYKFKWWKIYLIGFISSFNKSTTGGGFGPLSSTGKIICGVDSKVSIATTTLAEVPICLLGFAMYVILNGFPEKMFTLTLILGAAIGGIIGPYICSKLDKTKLKKIVGILAIISGILILLKVFLK